MSKRIFYFLFLSCLLFSFLSCNGGEEATIPAISGITPSAGMTNSIDFPIAIEGQGFTSDIVILFDNTPIPTTYVDGSHLTGMVPNGLTRSAATVEGGNGAATLRNKQVFVKVQNSVGTSEQTGFTFYDNWFFPALSSVSSGEYVLGIDMTMTQDSSGVLYAVWSHLIYTPGADPTGLEIRFAHSENGSNWSEPQKINGSLSLTAFDYPEPKIMIGPNNKLSVLFSKNDPVKYYSFLWIITSLDGGNTWSEPELLNPASASYIPKAEDSPSFYIEPLSGNAHAAWSVMTFGFKYAIYYSHSLNSARGGNNTELKAFSSPIRISNYTNVSQGNSQVIANSAGDVDVVWFQPVGNDYYTKELWIASSTDGGNTFSEPVSLADRTQINQWWPAPDLTVDLQGNVYIVYTGPFAGTTSNIFLQKSSDHGATFSSPVNITNSTATSLNPLITSDALGNLTLVYQEVLNDRATIFSRRSTDGGSTFSAPIVAATVNLHTYTSANLKNPPHAAADFYPSYAPMARLLMTVMNKPLIVCERYNSSIPFIGSDEDVTLYELLYSLGSAGDPYFSF